MRILAAALLTATAIGSASAQAVQISIKSANTPTLDQSFECAAVYAVAAQGVWRQTGKPDDEVRAALRAWLSHVRSTSKKTNAELNQIIRPVVQTISVGIVEGVDVKDATLPRRTACARFETRETAPQPASATAK